MSGRNNSAWRQQGTTQGPSSNVSNAGTFEESPATNQQGANGGQGYSQTTVFDQELTARNNARPSPSCPENIVSPMALVEAPPSRPRSPDLPTPVRQFLSGST
ncbi:hypothetical protein HYQ46_003900 [Verticillium longisporum]|nr:hypothetical protein HYQ44_006564 [Verticillium longisporum]KAG7147267.1 hypothetical protein HYQ46_003900 [Verticillium longisporum]